MTFKKEKGQLIGPPNLQKNYRGALKYPIQEGRILERSFYFPGTRDCRDVRRMDRASPGRSTSLRALRWIFSRPRNHRGCAGCALWGCYAADPWWVLGSFVGEGFPGPPGDLPAAFATRAQRPSSNNRQGSNFWLPAGASSCRFSGPAGHCDLE